MDKKEQAFSCLKKAFRKKATSHVYPIPPYQFRFATRFSNMNLSKVTLIFAIIQMASAGPAPSPEFIEETIRKSRNRVIYGNDCGPEGCPTSQSTTTTSTTSPPQTIPKEIAWYILINIQDRLTFMVFTISIPFWLMFNG